MNITFPIRSRETLSVATSDGYEPEWLHFWGHAASKDGSVTKTCFSQWWAGHAFTHEGVHYATAEHFMMAGKARLFQDDSALGRILAAQTPAEAKKLGRLVQKFDDTVWKAARWDIVVQGNLAKFGQHPDLSEFLLQTRDQVIVEASPFDRIWGIGMGSENPNARNPSQWKGLNLLGFALMEVRERLRALLTAN